MSTSDRAKLKARSSEKVDTSVLVLVGWCYCCEELAELLNDFPLSGLDIAPDSLNRAIMSTKS